MTSEMKPQILDSVLQKHFRIHIFFGTKYLFCFLCFKKILTHDPTACCK